MVKNNDTSAVLLENMNTSVLLFDAELSLIYMNMAAQSLLKLSFNRAKNVNAKELFAHDTEITNSLIEASLQEQPFTKRQQQLNLAYGETTTVDYSVSPIEYQQEKHLIIEIQAIDRALRISKEEMLLSSQDLSRQFIRGLAHEIKNPLGGLRGSAQLLERQLDDKNLKDYTDIIIKEADRLRQLVDNMLGPYQKMDIKTVNIHEILEHVRKLIDAQLLDSGIKAYFDYDPSLPEINADQQQLVQAILNIANNAIQAMEENNTVDGQLMFRTRAQRQFTIGKSFHRLLLRIDIEDNGPGIPENIKENLFFPMVTGRSRGTGLGLSIAQTIIQQHKGLIKFESKAGCTIFSLYLPITTGKT